LSRYITFKIPEVIDGIDIIDKLIIVRYVNALGQFGQFYSQSRETITEDDEKYVLFDWIIESKVTAASGYVTYDVSIYDTTFDGINTSTDMYILHTLPTNLKVEKGLLEVSLEDEDYNMLSELIDQFNEIITQHYIEVKQSEANAKSSENAASKSEANAKASENAASKSESNAASSASTAASSATNSANSATASKNSATNSANSATASANSATDSANSATDSANSASAALNSQNAAKTSETNAANSEKMAKSYSDNASQSETNAKTSEANAKTSETNAKTSETNAGNSASAASISASNASNSANKAANSATNAASSESNAAQSANKAADSENAAAESAKAAAIDVANEVKKVTALAYTIDVPASGWKLSSNGYYTNTVSVLGMTSDTQLCCVELESKYIGNTNAETAFQSWKSLETGENSVELVSDTKITADFAFTAKQVKNEAVVYVVPTEVDDTLTVSGDAADSAVTGEKFDTLEAALKALGLEVTDGKLCAVYETEE
jgi:DNA polymerase III gamma/tau subunit